jgi:hypothetical protein
MPSGVFERCNAIMGTSLELMSMYEWIGQIKSLHQAGKSLPIVPLIEVAFSMDEKSFHEYWRRGQEENVRFECARTLNELECAGVIAPVFSDELLKRTVESMLSRDAEFRSAEPDTADRLIAQAHASLRPTAHSE